MLVKAKPNVWCDICAYHYGKGHILGQKPASWTVVSEFINKGKERHYCNNCAMEVSKWADGSYFSLDQQIQYTRENKSMTQGVLNGI